MVNWLIYIRVARAHTLAMSAGPILCTYFYSRLKYSHLHLKPFIFVAIAVLLFHLATNTISEYRDFIRGVDDGNIDGPKYRLVSGIIEPTKIKRLGTGAFSLASISGIIALALSSMILLIPGIIGAGLSLFYSEWPLRYKYKSFGEIGVFIAYGPLLFFSCLYSLVERVCIEDMLLSIPIGLLTMCVLLANNVRDYAFDRGRIKTLPTVIGLKGSYTILFSSVHLSFLCIPILIYARIIPPPGFLVLIAWPIIHLAIKQMDSPKFVDIFGIMQASYCNILWPILAYLHKAQ
ncbi:MAG: prenyltransferase [Holosporales bacterium]|jgi:1,4-dihydroxy-2-naphthoate octaprenyltransferase|nr:prenyltransferase [Holosporales bacterium]